VEVPVEVQFRTIAMDFWASLEHKIYYKYDTNVPADLLDSLKDAAETASELDERMERLHREIRGGTIPPPAPPQRLRPAGSAAIEA
jgi:putative GTP pyrophosphokinase